MVPVQAGIRPHGRDSWGKPRRQRGSRDSVLHALHEQRDRLRSPRSVVPRPGIPADLRRAVDDTIHRLRQARENMLEDLEAEVEHFKHSEENEDRFLVVVFGEVKAGKSALANHLAGLEFNLTPEQRGQCFVGDKTVDRLEEKPTECTRNYQGFRLRGLLWIDCPGVLSATFSNADLARRLVARADFIILVTSSDAPFKESEVRELLRLIQDSGNQGLEGCLIVSKSDVFEKDENPETGETDSLRCAQIGYGPAATNRVGARAARTAPAWGLCSPTLNRLP